MTKEELVALVRYEIDQAQGYDSDVLATVRANALNYYHGLVAPAPEGRSNIVSHDVADTVHSLLAQITPIFQSSIIEFAAESQEDEPQSQMESDFVRYQLEASDGYSILSASAHDALLSGNGWIKVDIDEQSETETEIYGELEPMQLQALQFDHPENEYVSIKETDNGYSVKRTTTTRELRVQSISPDVMLFTMQQEQSDIQELRMVGERVLYTSSQLKEMGVSDRDIESIPWSEDDYWPATRARDGIYQDDSDTNDAAQEAERLRECFDVYMRVDSNDNGSSELRHIVMGGAVLISDEPTYCVPYATGSPVPVPHRVQGIGMYELMYQIQDAKTHTMRQYMDNLAVMNSSRLGVVEGQVNMEDLTNGRINGIVRMRSPDAVLPLPAADIGGQAIQGLNYLDQVRNQRGGASVDLNDAQMQVMKSSSAAATGQMESAEKMAGWYCGNMVNTLLKDAYLLIHKKLRYEMQGQMQAKLRGKWQQTDTGEWQERKHVNVMVGMTSQQQARRAMGLNALMQMQTAAMTQGMGGQLTDASKIYNAAADWIRASDLGAPDEYLIDPQSEEAQQAAQRQSQQQQQMQAQQEQLMQQQVQLEQMKIDMDKYKVDKEVEWKYYDTNMDAEVKEADMTTKAILETEKLNNETVQQETDNRPN